MNTSHRIVVRCISNGAVCNTRFRQEFFPCYDIKRILLYSNVNVCCILACVQTYILICKISHFALSSGTTNSYKNSGWYWLIIHNSSRSRSDRRVAESHKISAKMKGFVAVFSGIVASGSVSGAPQNYVMGSCTSNCNIQDLSNLKHNQVYLNKCSVL